MPEMGEELQSSDDGFVANATSKEIVSPPPADDATTTEAVVEPGAVSLTGDETDEEIQAHLEAKYKGKGFSDNDREQVLRWHKGNTEAKTLRADAARLKQEAEAAKASTDALMQVAQLLPGGVQALREKGPTEFVKWATGTEPPQHPQSAQLDPSDPVHAQILAMKAEVDALKADREKIMLDRQMEEAANSLSANVDALKLKDDAKGTAKGVAMRLAEFVLATGGAKNPQLPTREEVLASVKEAKKLLSAYDAIISGETVKKIEDSAPKTPQVVAATETKPEAANVSDDWYEAETNGFIERAMRGKG